jgi:periplasmic divalent cation tolerance protein
MPTQKNKAFVLAYVTTKDVEQAEAIGRALLELHLVACINIINGMQSMYWWEGKLESAREVVLILKTEERFVDEIIAEVKRLHTYDCPCVIILPIRGGNPEYLQWLESSLKK